MTPVEEGRAVVQEHVEALEQWVGFQELLHLGVIDEKRKEAVGGDGEALLLLGLRQGRDVEEALGRRWET